MTEPSAEVILTGTTAAPPPVRSLRAGPTFRSRPDTAFPLTLVLADLCGLADAQIRQVSADPDRLAALTDPEGFLGDGEEREARGGTVTVTLNPYAVARLDIGHE